MQTQYNIHEAKSHLSRLIEQVEAGGEAVIALAGKLVVPLVPHSIFTCGYRPLSLMHSWSVLSLDVLFVPAR